MREDFLDTQFLDTKSEDGKEDFSDFLKNSKFVLKNTEDGDSLFFIEYNNERINSYEIEKIVKSKSVKLTDFELKFLEYISLCYGTVQTILKVREKDFDELFSRLKDTGFNFYIDEKKYFFEEKNFKFDIKIFLDENSNVSINFDKDYEIIFGEKNGFLVEGDKITILKKSVPISFFKEVYFGKSKIDVIRFIEIKKALLEKLKDDNVTIEQSVLNIFDRNKIEKVSDMVLKVETTQYFIIGELHYKILNEFFKVKNYRYDENSTIEKPVEIKTVLENNTLITYLCDQSLSEFVLEDIFYDLKRSNAIDLDRNPFLFKIPIGQLEVFLEKILPKLKENFEVLFKDGVDMKIQKEKMGFLLNTNLKKSLDLFEFDIKFKLKDKVFTIADIRKLISDGKRNIKFDDGTTITIENIRDLYKWIEFLKNFEFKSSTQKYNVSQNTILELDEFLKGFENVSVKSNDEYNNFIKEVDTKKPIEEISLPKLKDYEFRNYQKEGIFWLEFLKKYSFGGILADEMGLGKTLQTLALLNINKEKTHIVLCPKSLLFNWENEIKKYFPDMTCLVIYQNSKKREELIKKANDYDIIITSYSILQKDYKVYFDNNIEFNYMILDEAHYIKNMKTRSNKAVKTIKSMRKVILTGTPLENRLEELYGLFEIIMPNYLGTYNEFRRDFSAKIERNDKVSLEILQSKIRPFILRRTKDEVLKELPKKQEQIVFNEMTNRQSIIYNEILNRVKQDTEKIIEDNGRTGKAKIQILSALLRLRQVCNHPKLLDHKLEDEDMSAKVEQFEELLLETIESENKVLIFSQFTKMLDILENRLKENNILYERLDGTTKNRQEVVDNFNNDKKIKVFLISLKAGGVGLNLTSASNVFIYDPWWNPQVENQAIDRAHRIGQKKTVNVYKFITKNSIEEKILKLQERKANLFENIVKEDNDFIKNLEWDDLLELFD